MFRALPDYVARDDYKLTGFRVGTSPGRIALRALIHLVGEEGFDPSRGITPADFKSASSAGSDTRPGIRSRRVSSQPAGRFEGGSLILTSRDCLTATLRLEDADRGRRRTCQFRGRTDRPRYQIAPAVGATPGQLRVR